MSAETAPDYDFWVAVGTLALAGVTAVLAFLTWRVLDESKKARTEPIFALEPEHYLTGLNEPAGEKFLHLHLVNHGAPATDIVADIGWFDSEGSAGSSRSFYVLSLAKDQYAQLYLDEHLDKITREKLFVRVKIKCRDAAGRPCEKAITNGLDKIRNTSIRLTSQYNYWQRVVDVIDRLSTK